VRLRADGERTGGTTVPWAVVCVPTAAWAQRIFPLAGSPNEAVAQLCAAGPLSPTTHRVGAQVTVS